MVALPRSPRCHVKPCAVAVEEGHCLYFTSVEFPNDRSSGPALQALASLGKRIQIHSVTHATSALAAEHADVLRLFPNCTTLSDSPRDTSKLLESCCKFPQIMLQELQVCAVLNSVDEMNSLLRLRKIEIMAADFPTAPPPVEGLVNALCKCTALADFKAFHLPLHTHHVLQLLNSCQLLVSVSVRKCGGQTISLRDILWFKRAGISHLQSLEVGHESLSDEGDEIVQHLERLIAHHPWDCWETVSVWRLFNKSRTGKSFSLLFNDANATLIESNRDRLVAALRSHAGLLTLGVSSCFNSMDKRDRVASAAAAHALADFHEALHQPIKVSFFIELASILDVKRSLPMVSHLHVCCDARFSTGLEFLHLVRTFPNLVELDVAYCQHLDDCITDSSMQALFAGCPLLKTAHVGKADVVTNRTLQGLLESMRLLRKLTFRRCQISPKDIAAFRRVYSTLQILPVPMVTVEKHISTVF